ncbi:MAG: peptide deformylase [Drouetiella hepatica Uher 2000/2452]|jgi:peptide deformylase|uniref:Peptide deformylase n=1 Tax=Drouetiella hepatica Uher 2000/2452 TaxID=904376 RepID=A0A951QFH5_9CYAN|nr:peptide deformylase [Drouetiella hepatica Uher 2000/2452]
MTENLQISQLGDPALRQIAQPIDNVHDEWVQTLINNLMTTLLSSNGVGIAAPQVAVPYQMLIVASRPNLRYPNAPTMSPTVMINPRSLTHSQEIVKDWEGCLSVPGIRGLVPRYKSIAIEYTAPDGTVRQHQLTGFVARIFQHEFDHLSGLMFLDRVESTQDLVTEQEYLKRITINPD